MYVRILYVKVDFLCLMDIYDFCFYILDGFMCFLWLEYCFEGVIFNINIILLYRFCEEKVIYIVVFFFNDGRELYYFRIIKLIYSVVLMKGFKEKKLK